MSHVMKVKVLIAGLVPRLAELYRVVNSGSESLRGESQLARQ